MKREGRCGVVMGTAYHGFANRDRGVTWECASDGFGVRARRCMLPGTFRLKAAR